MRKLFLAFGLSGLLVNAACASAQAKSPVGSPTLEVPPAPPRVIEARPVETAPPEPVGEMPPGPVAPRPRPQAARSEPPAEPPQVAARPAAPATPILRTPGTADGAGVSRQVRDIIDRAKKTLSSIDYRRLNTERRAQYDSAKLLITQSEEALKGTNLEYARNLADKADRIAKELQIR